MITPFSIRNLQGFLNATGWRCIYGLNLGGGTLEQALAEGSFVARTLGSQLICVSFGNEPDLFKHRDQENKPWTCDEYLAKWRTFRAGVERLEGPAVDSRAEVTFGGAEVGDDGQFHPRACERLRTQSGKLSVRIPAYSVALIRMG